MTNLINAFLHLWGNVFAGSSGYELPPNSIFGS